MSRDRRRDGATVWSKGLRGMSATLNHDFCPWANRYVYWLKQPIGWFVIAAGACLLIGLTLEPQAMIMFAAIMAFMLVGVLWPWIEIQGLACRLRFVKSRIQEGESVSVRLDVVNRWPWPVRGLAIERGFFAEADGSGNPTAVALARIPGWSKNSYYWTFEPPRRGVYPAERPVLAMGFPFGIWHARRPIEVVSELIVWPKMIDLDSVPPVHGQDFTVAGMLSNNTGNEGDVLGVRPYRRGDSLRKVHWPLTARHDQLIVCEGQATARRTVRVTIDTRTAFHRGSITRGSLEWSIRIGATLCRQFHAHNSRVECMFGTRCLVAEAGPAGIQRLLDCLARLEPEPSDSKAPLRLTASNANLLSILVTTDRGVDRLHQNGSANSTRLVILHTDGFEAADREQPFPSPITTSSQPSWIEIPGPHQAAGALRSQWERICHDVWRTV